jgi:hypothetical protein
VGAVPPGKLDGLAGSLSQVIELCAPCPAASDGPDVDYVRRIKGKDSLDAFVVYNSPDGEGFVYAAAFAGYYRAGEYLETLPVAFSDSAVDIHGIADFEMRCIFPEALGLYSIQQFSFHWLSPSKWLLYNLNPT